LLKERLGQTSDQSQLQVIQGGGHFLLNQSPQQVLDFIISAPIISAPKQLSPLSQNRD
jgi:surfactin synthase thioesterase subunit